MTFELNPGQKRAMGLLTSGCRYIQLYGGSRSGKTALLVGCVSDRALIAPGSRHLIARRTAGAVTRSIAKDTFPKMWRLRYPDAIAPEFNGQYGYFSLPNGSEIWLGGLNDDRMIERILGNEYATIYLNEASEVPYSAFVTLQSRLAQVVEKVNGKALEQRFYQDLNPTTKQHWSHKLFIDGVDPETGLSLSDPDQYASGQINPIDNEANLSDGYLSDLKNMGARARRRFYEGEYSADDEDALWKRDWIKRSELNKDGAWPVDMHRIVVAIDPAASNKPGSDETGIVAFGLGVDRRGYVLADESGKYSPEEWAHQAVALYRALDADRVIAEANNGGDMVESVIRATDPSISFSKVHATRGKILRAEPIAALYELGKISHCGEFPELEDQMCALTIDFDRRGSGYSPDRVDALVWAATEVFPNLTARRKRRSTLPPAPQFSMV